MDKKVLSGNKSIGEYVTINYNYKEKVANEY